MVNTDCITPVTIKQLHVPETSFFFSFNLVGKRSTLEKKTNGEELTTKTIIITVLLIFILPGSTT